MKIIVALAFLLAATASAVADEKPVPLKDAPGRDMVEAACSACHSLDYIRTNSPFLAQQGWTAEVNKMANAFGAPIPADSVPTIVDYLTKNYGAGG